MAVITRTIASFDLKSRQTLTQGGTVLGGNGITYKFDPLTGMVVNARPAAPAPYRPAAPAPSPYAPSMQVPVGPGQIIDQPAPAAQPTQPVQPTQPSGPSPADAAAAAQATRDAQFAQQKEEDEAKQRRDSYARLNSTLSDYGLGSLGTLVQQWLIEGLSEAEIVQRMRDTDQFKTRFPGIGERTKKGMSPISPGEYVAYERNARQMFRAAGLPEGFYDTNEDFTKFISNDLSIAELGDRVTLAANAAFKMPKEDRDALTKWGMGAGDLTAFWLNPDTAQPLLERKYAAAQLAGASKRSQYGDLTEQTASDLVQVGVTAAEATQGFGNLVQSKELFGALDTGEDGIDQSAQLDATFRGNAAAQRRIENRSRRRTAQFQAGGSFAANQGGISGLGDTQ